MGSGPSAPPVDYKAYWHNYYGWRTETAAGNTRAMASARARMASAGLKPGSELWNTNMSAAEKAMAEELAEIEGGHTASELQLQYQLNWRKADPNWRDDYGIHPYTGDSAGAPAQDERGSTGYATAPPSPPSTPYDATMHQFFKGQYFIDPKYGSIQDVKEGAGFSDFDFDAGPTHGQRYRPEDVREYGKLQYMKANDPGGVYDKLKDKFGRAPQNWEYYAALTYGLGEDSETPPVELARAASDSLRPAATQGVASGRPSPGLTRSAAATTQSPWV